MSAFYGIVIAMFFNEDNHPGRPHFHAEYSGEKATYDIRTLEQIAGRLHPRADRMIVEWGRITPVRAATQLGDDARQAAAWVD